MSLLMSCCCNYSSCFLRHWQATLLRCFLLDLASHGRKWDCRSSNGRQPGLPSLPPPSCSSPWPGSSTTEGVGTGFVWEGRPPGCCGGCCCGCARSCRRVWTSSCGCDGATWPSCLRTKPELILEFEDYWFEHGRVCYCHILSSQVKKL